MFPSHGRGNRIDTGRVQIFLDFLEIQGKFKVCVVFSDSVLERRFLKRAFHSTLCVAQANMGDLQWATTNDWLEVQNQVRRRAKKT